MEQNRADGFGHAEVVEVENGSCGSDQDHGLSRVLEKSS